ncbi:MAG: hypothetical protein EBR24_07000 [Flavobacteriia bacterium]|nr:hypothetical protein [Flavobacteriia bacterium]
MNKLNYFHLVIPQFIIASLFFLIIELDLTPLSRYDGLLISLLVLIIYLISSLSFFILPSNRPEFFASRFLLMFSLQIITFLTSVAIFVFVKNETRLLLYFLFLFLSAMLIQTAILLRVLNK